MGIFELEVFISTLVIALLSGILAAFMSYKWKTNRQMKSFAFWSTGLWVFTISVLLESIFSIEIYSQALIDTYLFLVVFLVESLALGSLYLLKNRGVKSAYIVYILIVDVILLFALSTSNTSGAVVNHLVYGILPLSIVIASSLGTFPAAIILVVVAALTYARGKNPKMLSIIAGTIVVSFAGTLYIVQFPEFLYYSEFIGIVLLWFGFFSFGNKRHAPIKRKIASNKKKGAMEIRKKSKGSSRNVSKRRTSKNKKARNKRR